MARASVELIQKLQQAARKIATGAPYEWGHMGSCNCGHLAQAITCRPKGEIHASALQRHGDWEQQLVDYCPHSGLPMDDIIDEMLALGLTRQDLAHLEKLGDPAILRVLPSERRYLRHNLREDVVLYLKAWAGLLEQQLLGQVSLPAITMPKAKEPSPALQ